MMTKAHKLTLIGLAVLAAAGVAGLILTGGLTVTDVATKGSTDQVPEVDQHTLDTARRLASLAVTPDEKRLAEDAVREADREVDTAFAAALRNADQLPTKDTEGTREDWKRVQQTEAAIKADQDKVKALTPAAGPQGSDQQAPNDDLELAQAKLALDQDALADAKEDLARSGGDSAGRIQRLWQEHEASEHGSPPPASSVSGAAAFFSAGSLIARWMAWSDVRAAETALTAAQQDALKEAGTLSATHNALEQHVQEEASQNQPQNPPGAAPSQTSAPQSPKGKAAALAVLHQLSLDNKNLADFDKRIQDLQQLGATYGKWDDQVRARGQLALHNIIASFLWIIVALLAASAASRLIERSFAQVTLERKQLVTLRGVARFSVEALAVLVILLTLFGSPNNMSTILGLAGAGLTVALKDFVVAFFGWFVLMGSNGVRVGDWVEINGVRGEVIEIDLMRTVLLETGNWTEPGRPTGRKISFLNGYAVEGTYFNFTTAGQWLWDELQLVIPWRADPYALADQISAMVTKETEQNASVAEQDWQHATRRYGVRPLSAKPTVSLKPREDGIEVTVRYIARATERAELRSRLNHAALKLIHGTRSGADSTETTSAPASGEENAVVEPSKPLP